MVLSIARQSVILKCLRRKSVLVGNYEFYYLAGLMNRLYHLELEASMSPSELLERIQIALPSITPNGEEEAYLIRMVSIFEVNEKKDSQMEELFCWGDTEEDLWKVNTDRHVESVQ